LLRDVLELRDLRELPTEEVAKILGISEAAAKSRLSRARAMLRDRMERHISRPTTLPVI
jgi:RNA polymerase sigma factor (sigma-70 family)